MLIAIAAPPPRTCDYNCGSHTIVPVDPMALWQCTGTSAGCMFSGKFTLGADAAASSSRRAVAGSSVPSVQHIPKAHIPIAAPIQLNNNNNI